MVATTPIFTTTFPMRWSDMDALGHVNNSVYFLYMEQARIAWFQQLNLGDIHSQATEGPILANASCTFLKPIVYPNTLKVNIWTDTPGRTSVHTHYHIGVEGKAEDYARGEATIVWMNYPKQEPTPIPPSLRTRLEEAAAAK